MKKIYQNFDGLDVTFQCAIPRYLLDTLKNAQQEAKDARKGVLIYIGKSQTQIEVAENGMKGGFAFRFDTGLDGAIWAIADSDHPERYNVKVSAKSLMLALYGYQETKNKILEFLIEELKAIPPKDHDAPLERVSRFDYCFDFLAEHQFTPDAKCFMTFNRSKKICHGNISNASGLDFSIIHQGRDIQTITIGKMPNRQITIYNKRREIMITKKSYWWDLWQLNPDAIKFDIWRVEVRAGKKELNKWNLRRFRDFENKAGDVIIRVLKDYRYIIPSEKDKNRNRWPCEPFWKECISSAQNYLVEYICNAERKEIISGQKQEIIKRYKAHINGVLISYAALQGLDISEIPTVLEGVNGDVIDAIRKNPQKFQNNFNKAEMKFEFINGKSS